MNLGKILVLARQSSKILARSWEIFVVGKCCQIGRVQLTETPSSSGQIGKGLSMKVGLMIRRS